MKRWIHASTDAFNFFDYYPKYDSHDVQVTTYSPDKIASMLKDEDPDTARAFKRKFANSDEVSGEAFIRWLSEYCKKFADDDEDRAEMMKAILKYTPW